MRATLAVAIAVACVARIAPAARLEVDRHAGPPPDKHYAFLRAARDGSERLLAVFNFHPRRSLWRWM